MGTATTAAVSAWDAMVERFGGVAVVQRPWRPRRRPGRRGVPYSTRLHEAGHAAAAMLLADFPAVVTGVDAVGGPDNVPYVGLSWWDGEHADQGPGVSLLPARCLEAALIFDGAGQAAEMLGGPQTWFGAVSDTVSMAETASEAVRGRVKVFGRRWEDIPSLVVAAFGAAEQWVAANEKTVRGVADALAANGDRLDRGEAEAAARSAGGDVVPWPRPGLRPLARRRTSPWLCWDGLHLAVAGTACAGALLLGDPMAHFGGVAPDESGYCLPTALSQPLPSPPFIADAVAEATLVAVAAGYAAGQTCRCRDHPAFDRAAHTRLVGVAAECTAHGTKVFGRRWQPPETPALLAAAHDAARRWVGANQRAVRAVAAEVASAHRRWQPLTWEEAYADPITAERIAEIVADSARSPGVGRLSGVAVAG